MLKNAPATTQTKYRQLAARIIVAAGVDRKQGSIGRAHFNARLRLRGDRAAAGREAVETPTIPLGQPTALPRIRRRIDVLPLG